MSSTTSSHDMAATPQLVWTSQFTVSNAHTHSLPGDKILLPPSALEQLLQAAPLVPDNDSIPKTTRAPSFDPFNPYSFAAERHARAQTRYEHQQLPHPLTFRLVNPATGHVVYAGIEEFSAEDGCIALSDFLAQALGIKPGSPHTTSSGSDEDDPHPASGIDSLVTKITVHAQQIARGTFVKLRPLEAGYDPEDWKSLLEEHLRKNYTTLTKGEVLTVPAGRFSAVKGATFQFLVDELKPDGDAICVVDTDLEVDIEALNEEQARETMRQIAQRLHKQPGSGQGSSTGGQLAYLKTEAGQILPGEYVDYQLPSWDRSQGLEIELKPSSDAEELELFASPLGNYQRAKPRDDEYVFSDYDGRPTKRLRISPTNTQLEDADSVLISVHAPSTMSTANPIHYTLRATPYEALKLTKNASSSEVEATMNPDDILCKNCLQPVPKRTLVLHENFCLRNNILCPQGCGRVFQKRSEAWQTHWHCEHDSFSGDTASSHNRHNQIFHEPAPCSSCSHVATSLPTLAAHRTTTCPGKLILCRFCHLEVPQEGDPDTPNVEAMLSGLTPHELADGGRTTECHICSRIVRLRDMTTHLKHHDLERKDRPAPRMCRNVNCGRTLDGTSPRGDTRAGARMGQGPGNDIGLCSSCFGPLYVTMHDPDGKALKRRVERRYLSQVQTGCGKTWCRNEYCKSGRGNAGIEPRALSIKDALPVLKPFLDGLMAGITPLHFCVDEGSQKRKGLAEMMAAERRLDGKVYGLPWCIGALEAAGGKIDGAEEWLKNFAPSS